MREGFMTQSFGLRKRGRIGKSDLPLCCLQPGPVYRGRPILILRVVVRHSHRWPCVGAQDPSVESKAGSKLCRRGSFTKLRLHNSLQHGLLGHSRCQLSRRRTGLRGRANGQDATIVASTIASLMLTYGCIALASAHVTKAGVSQLLGLIRAAQACTNSAPRRVLIRNQLIEYGCVDESARTPG